MLLPWVSQLSVLSEMLNGPDLRWELRQWDTAGGGGGRVTGIQYELSSDLIILLISLQYTFMYHVYLIESDIESLVLLS